MAAPETGQHDSTILVLPGSNDIVLPPEQRITLSPAISVPPSAIQGAQAARVAEAIRAARPGFARRVKALVPGAATTTTPAPAPPPATSVAALTVPDGAKLSFTGLADITLPSGSRVSAVGEPKNERVARRHAGRLGAERPPRRLLHPLIGSMASMNEAVAGLLREYAELLAITGGDPFRARNYEKAAKAVAGHPADVTTMAESALTTIPGVGKSIAAKITEFKRTGTIKAVEEQRAKVPPGVRELTRVPGLGPKRAMQLSRELGIATVSDLEAAVSEGKLRNIAGFGPKSEERIQRGLAVMTTDRVLLNVALSTATDIVGALRDSTERVEYAGSLRRWRETIGDVDILATAGDDAHAERIMTAFREMSDEIVVSGPTKTSIRAAPVRPPAPAPVSRSTCGSSGRSATAPPCSTSPARRRTTSRSARSRSGPGSSCRSTGCSAGTS